MSKVKKKGFTSLPTSLKIFFVIAVLNVLSGIAGLLSGQTKFIPIAGFIVEGTFGLILAALLSVLIPGLLLYFMWDRETWIWIVAIVLLALNIINSALAIPILEEIILRSLPPEVPADMVPLQVQITTFTNYVTMGLTALFAWFFYVNRKHFKG